MCDRLWTESLAGEEWNGFMKNVVPLSLQLVQPVTFVYNKNFENFKIIKYVVLNFNYFYCQSKYMIHML